MKHSVRKGILEFGYAVMTAPPPFNLLIVGAPILTGMLVGVWLLRSARRNGVTSSRIALGGLALTTATIVAIPVFAIVVGFLGFLALLFVGLSSVG